MRLSQYNGAIFLPSGLRGWWRRDYCLPDESPWGISVQFMLLSLTLAYSNQKLKPEKPEEKN